MTSEKIEEVERGYRLKVTSTRGTDVRDQDKLSAEVRAESIEEFESVRPQMREAVTEEMEARRALQPDGEEEDDQ